MDIPHKYLLLDACVLLNLMASGVFEDIANAALGEFIVCELVRNESYFLRADDDSGEIIQIDLDPYCRAGKLEICNAEGDWEIENYVNFAAQLDDGEAMTLAIGISRKWPIATDDKKARRLFLETSKKPGLLFSTAQLLRIWAEENDLPKDEVKNVLIRIERVARFTPPISDKDFQWWIDNLA